MKKLTMKFFIIIAVFLYTFINLTGCKQKFKETGNKEEETLFDTLELGATNQKNNLSIEARFDECGEWGGHKEKIKFFADSTMTFHANYQVFPFKCDSLDYYYSNQNLKPTVEKTIVLGDKEKKSVRDYFQRLKQSKITEKFPGHAGNIFTMANSDSTLLIKVYDQNEATVKSYKRLVTELFE
jgi:hypothetical protein